MFKGKLCAIFVDFYVCMYICMPSMHSRSEYTSRHRRYQSCIHKRYVNNSCIHMHDANAYIYMYIRALIANSYKEIICSP